MQLASFSSGGAEQTTQLFVFQAVNLCVLIGVHGSLFRALPPSPLTNVFIVSAWLAGWNKKKGIQRLMCDQF